MVIAKASDQAERPKSQNKSVRILLGWVLFLCLLHWHHSLMAVEGEQIVTCGRIQSMGQVCDLDFVFNYCCQPRQQYEKLLIKSQRSDQC